MNIGPGLISGERSFLVGVYSGGPIFGWAYKRDGSFVRTKIKQYSQLQNIFYLYNLKTDKIKYLLVPLHNWIEIGIEIASTHIKCMEKSIKKAVCAKKLKGINNFLILCSFLYFIEI